MRRFLSIVWWLSVCSVCSVGTLRAQPANVQADPTTGVLFRPSAATFISGNNLATATGGIVLGANGGTGVANTGKTITLGGNVTTVGAYNLGVSLSGNTTVSLPTTGTLATLTGSETLTNKTLTSPTLTTPILGAATATSLTLSGNISSAAWTTSGVRLKGVAATLTDTTSTGTVAAAYTDVLGGNTIAASNATTFTDYITAYFREPTAGSLVTMTNKWALGSESLRVGTSTPMTVSTAGAITANSLTGQTTTNLTLAGGSTGASLVLGQGATAGNATLSATGTGRVVTTPVMQIGSGYNVAGTLNTLATVGTLTLSDNVGFNLSNADGTRNLRASLFLDATNYRYGLQSAYSSASDFRFVIRQSGADQLQVTQTGNLLIGGTTDIPGSGGLKVFGTTAASSTASGALQVAGGVGVAGAGHFGGNLSVGPTSATAYAGYGVVAISNATNGGVLDFLIGSTVYGEIVGNSSGLSFISAQTGTAISFGVNGISDVFKLSGTTLANGKAAITYNSASTGVGTGALQVAGGIYAGAATYINGQITTSRSAQDVVGARLLNSNAGSNTGSLIELSGPSKGAYLISLNDGRVFLHGNAAPGQTSPSETPFLSFLATGAATFAGAVTMNGALTFSNGTPRVSTNDGALLMESSSGNNQGIFYIAPSGTATTSKIQMYGAVSSSTNYVRHEFSQTGSNTTFNQQAIGSGTLGTTAFQFNGTPALTLSATTTTVAGSVVTSSTTLSGAGAIPITTSLVKFTSTGASQALTLANGVDGQRLTIVHDVDGGSGVLTPTTKTGFTTVTFTNAGDTVSLVYVTTRGWMVTGSYLATIAP